MKWKRIVGWIAVSLVGFVLLALLGGLLFLHTNLFQFYALRKISDETYAATGAKAEIRGLELSLSNLTARLEGITLRGKESPSGPPLATVDQLTVTVKIQSLFNPQITLQELLINHP